MIGSILYNFWGSLIAFTITFIIMYQISIFPSKILLVSFLIALITFLLMFAIRYLIGYVLYTPDDKIFESLVDENETTEDEKNGEVEKKDTKADSSTVEFEDESPEEIAIVVRTMLNDNN